MSFHTRKARAAAMRNLKKARRALAKKRRTKHRRRG